MKAERTEVVDDAWSGVAKPQRWDVPFWQESIRRRTSRPMTSEVVGFVREHEPFSRIDPARFPESIPLEGILMNDARVRRFAKGELIVRQGDYGNSAFFIMNGTVRVLLEKVDDELLGRSVLKHKSPWSALAQLWTNPLTPELRHYREDDKQARKTGVGQVVVDEEGGTTVYLQDVPTLVGEGHSMDLQEGDLFGEIAAITRTPRTATIVANERCELLEIRWQGLRDIRRHSHEVKLHVDRLYRERSLRAHLRSTPMFAHLDEAGLSSVAEETEFLTFGNFDWNVSYKKVQDMSPAERLRYEPVVAEEGHYPNGVFLIRSGFARLSERYNNGERTVSYLGRGQVFGFEEIACNSVYGRSVPFRRTLRGLGYVDVLFIPTAVIERHVLPNIDRTGIADLGAAEDSGGAHGSKARMPGGISHGLLEFLVERRFINGTAAMIIDMDRCTRCDDCVRACASMHQNNPRFIRHGPVHEGYMIANACLHCQDPVCMIGCPTGAIHRASAGGNVVINDGTCIGCATCANACPYDNIQVVAVRDGRGRVIRDQVNNRPIEKAAKCDLCVDQLTGPACVNACPHDAMVRADMADTDTLAKWLRR